MSEVEMLEKFLNGLRNSEIRHGSITLDNYGEMPIQLLLFLEKMGKLITNEDFKNIGFDGYSEFYFLRKELREKFLEDALKLLKEKPRNFKSEIKNVAKNYLNDEKRRRLIEKIYYLKEEILEYYPKSELKYGARYYIEWDDGSQLGFGFASWLAYHNNRETKLRDFEKIGFKDILEFYSIPRDIRDKFLSDGLKLWRKMFGENLEKLSYEEIKEKYEKFIKELHKMADEVKKYIKK